MKNQYVDTDKIVRFLYDKCWTKFRFCKECKISRVTFDKILRGENVRLVALFKISNVMNCFVGDLIKKEV